jgi:prepilin-type N-terminal cleavage/methylation domain-containing protein
MGSLVVKVKMQISGTGLNKGFTILEVLIVLTIIAISGTSFYLILNQPNNSNSYQQIIHEYEVLSLYNGNTYGFSKSNIHILNDDIWVPIKNENFEDIYSVTNKSNQELIVEGDEIFLIVSPGYESSIQSITLMNGEKNDT